jgi:hypothetical protein
MKVSCIMFSTLNFNHLSIHAMYRTSKSSGCCITESNEVDYVMKTGRRGNFTKEEGGDHRQSNVGALR